MFLCKESVLQSLLINNDNNQLDNQALRVQANSSLLLQTRRRNVESVRKFPMMGIILRSVQIEPVANAISGWQANAVEALTAATSTLLDLQNLLHQLLLLLQYLLLPMEHHLHTNLLQRLCLHSRLCQQLWRTLHLWLRLAHRRFLAETPPAQSVLRISCVIWRIGANW
tara:strand:- start:2711 stop:3217 length:507 start_codon:yes stop_codon:yes gene_type:complete